MNIKNMLYYAKYGLQCFILGQQKPLVAGIAVTDVCNLHCAHCVVNNMGRGHESFSQLKEWIDTFYDKGARILYLQGGEPLCWKEEEKNINNVIDYARTKGFHKIAVATNGTLPLEVESDFVWISIDGMPETHNLIRKQEIFHKILENVSNYKHKTKYANMAVNIMNFKEVEEVVHFIAEKTDFNGISINFHTPYKGVEHLFLPLEERAKVIEKVLALQTQGLPIINSAVALKALGTNKYKKPTYMIEMIDHGILYQCCFGREKSVCEKCGYGIIAEFSCISTLQPRALKEAVRLFK